MVGKTKGFGGIWSLTIVFPVLSFSGIPFDKLISVLLEVFPSDGAGALTLSAYVAANPPQYI